MNPEELISPPGQPVEPWVLEALEKMVLRSLGGPGSGNFGHVGRPGEVGGSADRVMYHGTIQEKLNSIKERGLVRNGRKNFDISHDSVYLTASEDAALDWARMTLWDNNEDATPIVIEVRVPEARLAELIPDRNAEATEAVTEFEFTTDIPPDWIEGVKAWDDASWSWRVLGDGSKTVYVCLLLKDDTETRSLGGPGSGHYGHAGIPGEVGGSLPGDAGHVGDTFGEITIIKKAKAPPATKDQIAKLVEMKQQKYNYAAIEKATGLNPKQAATIWFKYNKASASAKEILAKPTPTKATPPGASGPGMVWNWEKQAYVLNPKLEELSKEGYEWKQVKPGYDVDWAFFNKAGEQVSAQTYKEEWQSAAKTIKKPDKPVVGPETNPLFVEAEKLKNKDLTGTLDMLSGKGYVWQEKTTGPNKGKYAFFQNGIQVSAFGDKDAWDTAISTIHFGKGYDWKESPPPPAPGKIGGAHGLYADTHGTIDDLSTLEPWPLDDGTVRKQNSTYEDEVYKIGVAWKDKLTASEKAAIKSYTGSGSGSTNHALYAQKMETSNSKLISSGLAKSTDPPPPSIVWRGVPGIKPSVLAASLNTGDVIQLNGFQSTSINPDKALSWSGGQTFFEIKPKKGAYVYTVSSHGTEKEFLLPTGKKYIVRGIKELPINSSGNKRLTFQLEMTDDE